MEVSFHRLYKITNLYLSMNPEQEQPVIPDSEMKFPTQMPGQQDPTEEHRGMIIIILGAALIILLVGLFLWYRASQMPVPTSLPEATRPTAEMNNEPESTTAEAQTESFGALSTSDEIDAIEADLESTNLESLDSELLQIETELNAQI